MKSKTETLSAALRILANDIQSPDDVPAMCLREAADRLEELQRELDEARDDVERLSEKLEVELNNSITLQSQRDEARAEQERLIMEFAEANSEIEKLSKERYIEKKRADGHYENYCEILKKIDSIANQRDKAWAEAERLKAELSNPQPKTTRPEPSRLEIAAMLYAARATNAELISIGTCMKESDALIAAAKETK